MGLVTPEGQSIRNNKRESEERTGFVHHAAMEKSAANGLRSWKRMILLFRLNLPGKIKGAQRAPYFLKKYFTREV